MRSIASCGIYHDTRRPKKDGTYPVKIRVIHERVPRLYKTAFSLTKEDFKKSYGAKTPKGIYIRLNEKLRALEKQGREIVDEMEQFSFSAFEREFYDKKEYPNDVMYYYQKLFKEYHDSEQVSTNNNYKAALKSFLRIFFEIPVEKDFDIVTSKLKGVPFDYFTPKKLEYYERELLKKGKSITTVSIYLKSLRRVFRLAIKQGVIGENIFPFGKKEDGKYVIKETINNKRGLSLKEIQLLRDYDVVEGSSRGKALDFWFLTLYLRGTNMIDILKLKGKNISPDRVSFIRSKTKNSSRIQNEKFVNLIPQAKEIFAKYANLDSADDDYIFPVLAKGDSTTVIKKKVGNFTRSVNQSMKKIAREVGLEKPCSTMVARHSWASIAIDKNINIYDLMESMGHSKLSTTQNYLKSLGKSNIDSLIFEDS